MQHDFDFIDLLVYSLLFMLVYLYYIGAF